MGRSYPGIAEILYRKGSMDQFSPLVDLSNNERESLRPTIATSGNNVYVAWFDDIEGNSEILYRRSTDDGTSFGSTINLSNSDEESVRPAIIASGNNVYLVWIEGQPSGFGNNEIFYKRSIDGGVTFGPTINLSNGEGNSFGVRVNAMFARKCCYTHNGYQSGYYYHGGNQSFWPPIVAKKFRSC
jgi:hypothetical protein